MSIVHHDKALAGLARKGKWALKAVHNGLLYGGSDDGVLRVGLCVCIKV